MTGGGIDRRGPKDSENAHNSFLTKCTEKGFWIFATDMIMRKINKTFKAQNLANLKVEYRPLSDEITKSTDIQTSRND